MEAFHDRLGLAEIPAEPFAGLERVGADGAATAVVKLQTFDHELVPTEFDALTLQ